MRDIIGIMNMTLDVYIYINIYCLVPIAMSHCARQNQRATVAPHKRATHPSLSLPLGSRPVAGGSHFAKIVYIICV